MIIHQNRAYLAILKTQTSVLSVRESYEELKELAESALMKIVGSCQGNVLHPSPRYFVHEGKLTEILEGAKKSAANVVVFNVDLSPAQASNIEKILKIKIVDRTGLILQIFSRRAKTNAGKLQVELARLNYLLPRLKGLGTVMSRLGGGVGTRGPGEQELEWDRRKIRRRIERVKEDLKKVRSHRQLLRSSRKRKNLLAAAIVGYTNAGKSTLLNSLTGAGTYVEDKLFATLDPLTRVLPLGSDYKLLLIDTVGFIRDLPHTLVEAFHATLEEVSEADFLIHALDVSNPHASFSKAACESVLKEIGALEKPTILALNKADLLEPDQQGIVHSLWPSGVMISAKNGDGLKDLLADIEYNVRNMQTMVAVGNNYSNNGGGA